MWKSNVGHLTLFRLVNILRGNRYVGMYEICIYVFILSSYFSIINNIVNNQYRNGNEAASLRPLPTSKSTTKLSQALFVS